MDEAPDVEMKAASDSKPKTKVAAPDWNAPLKDYPDGLYMKAYIKKHLTAEVKEMLQMSDKEANSFLRDVKTIALKNDFVKEELQNLSLVQAAKRLIEIQKASLNTWVWKEIGDKKKKVIDGIMDVRHDSLKATLEKSTKYAETSLGASSSCRIAGSVSVLRAPSPVHTTWTPL